VKKRAFALMLALALLLSGCSAKKEPEQVSEPTSDAVLPSDTAKDDVMPEQPPEATPAPPVQTPNPEPEWAKTFTASAGMGDLEPGMSAPEGMLPLKELPVHYSNEQAAQDGCVAVVYDSEANEFTEYGIHEWNDFRVAVKRGQVAGPIRRLYDFSPLNNDDYFTQPMDISFDGERYIVKQYIRHLKHDAEYELCRTFRYLQPDEFDANGAPLDTLCNNYNNDLEAAWLDGCIVTAAGISLLTRTSFISVLRSGEKWDEFLESVAKGECAKIRVAVAYPSEGVQRNDSLEYIETGDYLLEVTEIEYDGVYFYAKEYDSFEKRVNVTRYTHLNEEVYKKKPLLEMITYTLTFDEKFTYDVLRRNSGDSEVLGTRIPTDIAIKSETIFIMTREI